MILDEVYQAALAAGSGGIRWNSETAWIQLADENKNWINYKRYNPYKNISIVAFGDYSSATATCQEDGLYMGICCSYASTNVSSTGSQIKRYTSNNKYALGIYECHVGDTVTVTGSQSTGRYCTAVYYLRGYSRVLGDFNLSYGVNTHGYSDGVANFICGGGSSDGSASIQFSYEGESNTIRTPNTKCYVFALTPTSDYCNIVTTGTNAYQSFVAYGNLE